MGTGADFDTARVPRTVVLESQAQLPCRRKTSNDLCSGALDVIAPTRRPKRTIQGASR
jgi:hypothetical protein